MSYVAIRGGAEAIAQSNRLLDAVRALGGDQASIEVEMIERQMPILHGRVLSEGGLYHPTLAALALKQSLGDPLEAAFMLRAYRSTQPRLATTPIHDTSRMRLIRRISAAFKDIPGGQMLGPTPDYLQRLFRFDLIEEDRTMFTSLAREWLGNLPDDAVPATFPKVIDALRAEGLLAPASPQDAEPFDITRAPLVFPVPRSAALATMARGETGGLLALAYSNMRGYGDVHPTVGELRVGYLPILLPHPATGELIEAGEVLITECEIVAMYEDTGNGGKPTLTLGYGACFGHNEVKAIAMAILDRSMQAGITHGPRNPSEDPEFVLLHVDGIESMGFCTHYKMPHYITFQSDLDRLRTTQKKHAQKAEEKFHAR
ncbi:MAG: carbon-phosphorus lyase [Rhodospirillales bacterium]|nr:carbon-phosphorus lyase [Rhodospirillales bacterium]